jgi:hypothetical protein
MHGIEDSAHMPTIKYILDLQAVANYSAIAYYNKMKLHDKWAFTQLDTG